MDANFIIQKNIMRFVDNISFTKMRMLNKAYSKIGTIWNAIDRYGFTQSEKLELIRYHFRYLPIQGSAKWKSERAVPKVGNRVPCVGGSELAQLVGDNPYSDKYDLLLTKLGKNINIDDVNTRWGNLYEDVLFSIVKKILDNDDIFETGSINGLTADGNPIQNYSPDGIGLCKSEKIRQAFRLYYPLPIPNDIRELLTYQDEVTVLFEGKSPLGRKPDGKTIASHYVPQPKIGLCTIPICDFAVFTEGVFRICGEKDWNWEPNINEDFHKSEKHSSPKYLGAILFVSKLPSEEGIIDFGSKDKTVISKLLEKWSEDRFNASDGAIKAIYPEPISDNIDLDLWMDIHKKTPNLVGILYWKCFSLSFIPVSKDPQYGEKCFPKIYEFHSMLKTIINTVPPDDIVKYINTIREREMYVDDPDNQNGDLQISWNFKSIVNKFARNGNLMF